MTGGTLVESVRCLIESAGAPPDSALLERFAATRDESAFAALVRRHGSMVMGVCRRVAWTRHDAEDAFQVTFLELARQASAVGRRGSLAAWLCRVAYRAARKARRKPLAPLPETVAPVERDRTPPELDEELDRLPAIYREPLVLVYLHGLSNAEAAARLGCPVGTIFTRLSRGRDRLRAALARRGIGSLPVLVPAVVPPALVGRVVASALMVRTSGMLAGIGGAIVLHKMKAVAAVLLLASAVAAGVMLPSRPASVPAKIRHAAPPVGEPLPEGVLARLGSAKFRHAGLWEFVCLPGGKTVLTSGGDGLLRTWDLATGKQVREARLEGTRETTYMTRSPDGRAAAAHSKGKIVLWDAATGKEGKTFTAPKGEWVYLLFGGDLRTLAVWTPERLDLHDLKKDTVRTIALPERRTRDNTFHGSFSPDGKHLSLGGGSNEALCIYDVLQGKELHRFACHATGSVFSPDGKSLIVSSMRDDKGEAEPSIRVYDVISGKALKRVTKGIPGTYFTLTFSPDGKKIFCSGWPTACIFDATTFEVLREIKRRLHLPRYSFDGKKVLSTNEARLRFWDSTTGAEIDGSEGEFGTNVPRIAISPDGRLLASGDWLEDEILLWDLKTGRVVRRLPLGGSKAYPRSVAFSADGKTLTVPQYKGFIQTWDVATGNTTRAEELDNPGWPTKDLLRYYSFLVSPDGRTVSTLEDAFTGQKQATSLSLWDRKTGKRLTEHFLPANTTRAAWRPDGLAVALLLEEGLTLLDVRTGKPIWETAGPVQRPIHASTDFRLIVAGKTKTTLGVWESATGKEVASLKVGTFAHVALAADNRTLVMSDAERLRVVDLASGKEVRSHALPVVMKMASDETFVKALALTPDAGRAFTATADGTGIVWAIDRKRPARTATEQDLAAWWSDLASDDAGRAWRAAWALTDAKATAFLEGRLRPAPVASPALLALIAALDADAFAEREAAEKALSKSGAAVVPALRVARDQASSAEAKRRLDRLLEPHGRYTADELRRLRAADVLRTLDGK
jgi:RNA polymerase sigma factor (sigma-70 family)